MLHKLEIESTVSSRLNVFFAQYVSLSSFAGEMPRQEVRWRAARILHHLQVNSKNL
jgi:hypothetical protein